MEKGCLKKTAFSYCLIGMDEFIHNIDKMLPVTCIHELNRLSNMSKVDSVHFSEIIDKAAQYFFPTPLYGPIKPNHETRNIHRVFDKLNIKP